MDYVLKDYFIPSFPTMTGVAKSTAVVGSFTMLPMLAEYVYNNGYNIPFTIGFSAISFFGFKSNFEQYLFPYKLGATLLYGAAGYIICEATKTVVDYITEEFGIDISEYGNIAVSSVLAIGAMSMMPHAIKVVAEQYINVGIIHLGDIFGASVAANDFVEYDVEDHEYGIGELPEIDDSEIDDSIAGTIGDALG